MSDKAGHLFSCVCCSDEKDESEAKYDTQLNGPICFECQRNTNWAVAYMKKAGISRPLNQNDLNPQLKARFGFE
jgi:hypothetical protein